MSERYLHQATCGTCRGELELWMCRDCQRPFSWCAACRLARGRAGDPAAPGEKRLVRSCPSGHAQAVDAPTLDELSAAGLVAVAVAAPRAPEAPSTALGLRLHGRTAEDIMNQEGREAATNMWWSYGLMVFLAFMGATEAGTDMVLPLWALGPFVAFVIAMGWTAWPRFLRDPRAIGLAIAATLPAVWFVAWMAAAVEPPGEHLRGLWRWYALFGSVAAAASAFQFAPDAVARWVAGMLAAFFRARG